MPFKFGASKAATRTPFWNDLRLRSILFQAAILAFFFALAYFIFHNTSLNLEKRGIASGFDFLWRKAGFNINQHLIPYSEESIVAVAFLVGLINTLVLAATSIFFATIIGFGVGFARLSNNWLVNKLATIYVESIRNIPLLLQIFFWYFAVLQTLPPIRQSMAFFDVIYFNNRGLYFPVPEFSKGFWPILLALLVALAGVVFLVRRANRRQDLTGKRPSVLYPAIGMIVGFPLLAAVTTGSSVVWSFPVLRGFNFQGGIVVSPEFIAMTLGLSIYQAAYVAETVRAGVQSVARGQIEAGNALGLRRRHVMRLVVMPQALQVILPPMITIYVSVLRTSSIGVAIGYPDLVAIFAGTLLYQIGQAIEIMTITLLVYLTISLIISTVMNWYNRRIAINRV